MHFETCFKDSYGEGETFGITVSCILLIQHIIQSRDLPVGIGDLRSVPSVQKTYGSGTRWAYNWEFHFRGCNLGSIFIDILHPSLMLVKAIGRDSDDFDVALFEVFGTTSDLTELSGANGGEISRVGEENGLPHDV